MNVKTAFVTDEGVEDRYESHGNITVDEVELDPPKDHEVLVDIKANGVCHSDWHAASGDAPMPHYPCALGHEGAGVVQEVGDGVASVEEGDHIATSYVPACGRCERCAQGLPNLCVDSRHIQTGPQMDGTYRIHHGDQDVSQFCLLGTFSEAAVLHENSVVKIPDDVPFEAACLTGCGVTTGFGAAANRADINAGDSVVVMGFGGVGANAVQGAAAQGADEIIVVEPKDQRREWSTDFGATHTVDPDAEDPTEVVENLTDGQMADAALVTVDVVLPETLGQALSLVGPRGEVVMVAMAPRESGHIDMGEQGVGSILGMEKELKGAVYGGWGPQYAIPRLLEMYRNGSLMLDELVTETYDLGGVNQAYDDMLNGRIIRGVVTM